MQALRGDEMLLSDRSILSRLKKGSIVIDPPLTTGQLRPVGIRVHLGSEISVPVGGQLVDLADPNELRYERHDIRSRSFILESGTFVLATTIERIKTGGDLLCVLEGRSTIARLGVTIHNTASFLDGSQDSWIRPVLEISNHGPLRIALQMGVPIGMLCFARRASRSTGRNVHEQYRGQDSALPPSFSKGATLLTSLLEQRDIEW